MRDVAVYGAVKNRRHGAANPRAQHPSPVTEVVETMDGGVSGLDGNACVVAVLEDPGGRADPPGPS